MKIIESISVSEDATLFSLSDSPADISFIAGIFEKIAEAGIDVDMISQFLPNSSHAGLSFTVSDDDFGGVLEIATQLRAENKKIKISVSSGNCKISVNGGAAGRCGAGIQSRRRCGVRHKNDKHIGDRDISARCQSRC